MAKANPPQPKINIPFKVDTMSDGSQVVSFPGISDMVFEYFPTSDTSNENNDSNSNDDSKNSFSVGYFNEAWLESNRSRMANIESDLMHHLITVYYGLWPKRCYERLLFENVSSVFAKLEELLLKRANLAKRLFSICDKPSHAREYAAGFAELQRLNKSLPEPIYTFYERYGILEQACQIPGYVGQHPEVVAFLADLDKTTNEFRDGAWDERTEAMDACARELEEKLGLA